MARLGYNPTSDLDPNIVELLFGRLKDQLDSLVNDKLQRRQQWGPTFKQEDIALITLPDADSTVERLEEGKRTLVFSGPLTAGRVVRLPELYSAWWFLRNNTSQFLEFFVGVSGTTGILLGPRQTTTIYIDDTSVYRTTGNAEEVVGVKLLTDNTRTDLFQVAFGTTTDLLAVGGTVQLFLKAIKNSVPTVQAYTKTLSFIAEHHGNGAGNARWASQGNPGAVMEWIEDGITSIGGTTFTYHCNGTASPAIAGAANTFIFQITANTDIASPDAILLQYTVRPLGDVGVTISP